MLMLNNWESGGPWTKPGLEAVLNSLLKHWHRWIGFFSFEPPVSLNYEKKKCFSCFTSPKIHDQLQNHHSRDFLNRFFWKEAFNLGSVKKKTNTVESRQLERNKISAMRDICTSLRGIFDLGDVTWPSLVLELWLHEVMRQKISQCSSGENNSLRWFSSWCWILTL